MAIVDLNSNNVLLSSSSPSSKTLGVKLCDFGAADLVVADGLRTFVFATHAPASPSSTMYDRITKIQVDLFALGSTLCEIMLNQHPWEGLSCHEIGRRHEEGSFPALAEVPTCLKT